MGVCVWVRFYSFRFSCMRCVNVCDRSGASECEPKRFFFHYYQPFIFYHFFDYVVHPDTSLKEITVPFFDSPILLNLTYEFRFDTVASLSSFAQIVFLLFFFCNFTVQYIRFSSFCLYIPLIIIFYSFPFFMMQNANSDVLHYKKKYVVRKKIVIHDPRPSIDSWIKKLFISRTKPCFLSVES